MQKRATTFTMLPSIGRPDPALAARAWEILAPHFTKTEQDAERPSAQIIPLTPATDQRTPR